MKFLKLDKLGMREKLLLGIGGVVIGAIVIQFSVVQPVIKYVNKMDQDILEQIKQVQNGIACLAQKAIVDAEFGKYEALLGPPASDAEAIARMKEEIENLATGANLVGDPVVHREPRVSKESAFGREYLVELPRFEAKTEDVQTFLDALRAAPGLYRVEKLTLSSGKEEHWSKGSILISRLMLPPVEIAQAAAAKETAEKEAAAAGTKGK